ILRKSIVRRYCGFPQ
ncbi:hypothetical protein D043_0276B, partial [Vibrio parahaemolyticus EKP-021]